MNKASVVANLCKSCGFCVKFCPKQVIKIGDVRNSKGHYNAVVDVSGCIGCGVCALVCPEAAIDIIKEEA